MNRAPSLREISTISACLIGFSYPVSTYAVTKNATINLVVTVVNSCEAGVGETNPSFGTLNFGSAYSLKTPITVTGQSNAGAIRVKCTTGLPYKVVLGPGQSGNINNRLMRVNGVGASIAYNLYTNASHSVIWDNLIGITQSATGNDDYLPVYGLISAQTTPAIGLYTDAVQVTVSW